MSVFEDLIDELKNENLLEQTVIDLSPADAAARDAKPAGYPSMESGDDPSSEPPPAGADDPLNIDVPQIEKPSSEREFFRKRAMDEVSSLQMVEHVFSGVERQHMKISPVSYDDLNAKRALHAFLQVSADLKAPEHADAEFALRNETEAWSYALYERDQKISVANIRRFCEESRPVLSSQALIALARFYRNSPYSEDVRGKFDYVMTRLFSRESGEETRNLLFVSDEMIGHINTLYANWSSIALYTREDDQVEVSLTVTRFDEFTVEVENAESFDELLESDFFNRVRVYKEESAEMFYVPEVIAAAITCNLAIGNRYVALIGRERTKNSAQTIEEKYGPDYDLIVSNAAGKTLTLSDILALESDAYYEEPAKTEPALAKPKAASHRPKSDTDSGFDLFGVNKWLMIVCIVFILLGGGVYIWAEKFAGGSDNGALVAKPVEMSDPDLKKYLKSPRATTETLYAVTEPAFDTLSEDEQKDVLAKVQKFAGEHNFPKVNLINSKGRTVAFASKDRFELVSQ